MPPPAELRKRPQDGISWVHKVAAEEIEFRGAPGCLGGTWIYIGGRSTSVEQRRAHEDGGRAQGLGAPTVSWLPRLFLDAHSKSHGSRLLRKSRSRMFHSVWTPFDIPFLRNSKIGKKTKTDTGLSVNRFLPKII